MATSFLGQVLDPALVRLRLAAEDKSSAIRELVDLLGASGRLTDREEVERVVFARERVMSTGMTSGIAIPHGKTDCVERIVVGLGLKPSGVDFDCADGSPARILVITLSPESRPGPHLRFMGEISRVLREPEVREAVLSARSARDVVDVLVSA